MESPKTKKSSKFIKVDACNLAYEFNLLRLGIKNRIRGRKKEKPKDILSSSHKDIVNF